MDAIVICGVLLIGLVCTIIGARLLLGQEINDDL